MSACAAAGDEGVQNVGEIGSILRICFPCGSHHLVDEVGTLVRWNQQNALQYQLHHLTRSVEQVSRRQSRDLFQGKHWSAKFAALSQTLLTYRQVCLSGFSLTQVSLRVTLAAERESGHSVIAWIVKHTGNGNDTLWEP